MKKIIATGGLIGLLALCLLAASGCPMEAEEENPSLDTLLGTGWSAAEDTLVFVSENRALAADSFIDYSYDHNAGSIEGLGSFSVGGGARTLTFPAYKGGGQALFTRQADFAPGGDMVNTKWAFASISLKFNSPTQAAMGNDSYVYLYDDAKKTGLVETLGGFSFDDEAQTVTFSSYRGGSALVFQTELDSALVGSKWRWGNSLLEFTKPNKVALRNKTYTYVYESAPTAGDVAGLGGFSISGADGQRTLSFPEYKKAVGPDYGFAVDFAEQLTDTNVTIATTLAGTEWYWESIYGGYLTFLTETKIAGSSATYTWNPGERNGKMDVFGNFIVTNNDTHITFTNIKGYGHTAEFDLVE
ncbi:MAG: hypothetical protein LBL20_02380 [Treponema sp.]|nr:hypothetical protein [Treponema sp.]